MTLDKLPDGKSGVISSVGGELSAHGGALDAAAWLCSAAVYALGGLFW